MNELVHGHLLIDMMFQVVANFNQFIHVGNQMRILVPIIFAKEMDKQLNEHTLHIGLVIWQLHLEFINNFK
ncbi:hypothetical protein D3C71_1813890 [compost metagenome]